MFRSRSDMDLTQPGRSSTFTALSVWLAGPISVPPSPEERSFLLPVEPPKEFLEAGIGLDLLDRIELVAQFVMRPRFVDEILAGMARRSDVPSPFTARHNMVPSSGHPPVAECASFVHTVSPTFLLKNNHSCRPLKVSNPWLVSSTNSPPQKPCRVMTAKCRVFPEFCILHPQLFTSLRGARSTSRSGVQNWYARPACPPKPSSEGG